MTPFEYGFLGIQALVTVGSVVGFLIKNERRMTQTETTLKYLKQEHDEVYPHALAQQCLKDADRD